MSLYGVDDSALKIVKNSQSDVDVIFNLGNIGDNNAATHGGAIYIDGGATVSIHSARIGENTSPSGNGGAIYVNDSTLTLKWSNLHDNSATGNGGAIYFFNDSGDEHKLLVSGSSFRRNRATDKDNSTNTVENGGAIYIDNQTSTEGAISKLTDNSIHSQSARNGGAIYHANGKTFVDNSTIDNNSVSVEGGGIYVAGGNVTIRHSTVVRNRAANGGGLAVFADDNANTADPEVYVYNSLVAENTDTDAENSACLADRLSGNDGNIIEDHNCTAAQFVSAPVRIELVPFGGQNLPRAVITRFYRLLEGSPAIDNGVDMPVAVLSSDQTGHKRPEGEGYDSGAFEFDVAEVWVIQAESLSSTPSTGAPAKTKVKVSAHTCVDVNERDNGIYLQATYGLDSGVQCQEIDAYGIGIEAVVAAGFSSAVDIWGYVEQGVQVCFDFSGPMLFLDAATAPRTVRSLASFTLNGKNCTVIWRPGSIVVQSAQTGNNMWPLATAHPLPVFSPSPTPPPTCFATTTAAVNLRDQPNGNRIGGVYPGSRLSVLNQVSGWYQVDNVGVVGWISSDYADLNGAC